MKFQPADPARENRIASTAWPPTDTEGRERSSNFPGSGRELPRHHPGTGRGPSSDAVSTGRRILQNFLSLSGANFLCKGLSFISTAYLARLLSAEGYGILGFAQAVLVYFQLLINQGFDTFGAREIARSPEKTRLYVNNILSIRLILAVVSYALLALFAFLIPKPAVIKAAILILGVKLFDLTINLKWVFQGKEKMHWIAASRIIPQLLYLGAIFTLIHHPGQILRVPVIQVSVVLLGSFFLLLVYRRSEGPFRITIDPAFWKDIFRQSLPMAATYLLIQVYVNFDMLILGFTHNEETVGYYNAAYKLINTINLFGIYYFVSLFPNLSRLYQESREKLRSLISHSLKLAGMIAVPLGVGGTILAAPIIHLTFGEGFGPSALPFQILIWNVAIIWISLHYGNILMACDRQGKYMLAVAAGAVSNISLNLIFIPRYGMTAAALTTIFSEVVVLAITCRAIRGVIDFKLLGVFPRPVLAAAGMGALLVLLRNLPVPAGIGVGVCSYFSLLYLLGGIGREDLNRARSIVWRKRSGR